jgi:molecular chaperone GrpE
MTEHTSGGKNEGKDERQERPRVRVTDKRRVNPPQQGTPASAESAQDRLRDGARPRDSAEEPELEEARKKAAEYREHLQRLAADFDNYRKRVLKEQTRAVEMASEPLVRKLLEVLDEFELALIAAEQKPDFDRFLHGVELVYAKLKDILSSEGLERIDAIGRPFDPQKHEALMQSGHDEGDPMVADVLREGYTMRGRVIRPAGVKVVRQ